jgi:signal transduction histidine kinase
MLLMNDHSAQLDEEGLTFLKNIRRAANQMGQLIDDLLAYSRLDRRALEKSSLRLTDLISALLQEREVDLNTCNIEVVQEIECDQVYAEWDGLSQALRNLLDNSIKFLSQTPNPRIILRSEASDTACLISVRDNGIGFNMRYHDRIFDMFQRLHTQQEFPGTGIGLAVVRLAVQRMGGRVWAESIPDQGATFFLEIPK